jgi:thioredoxin reductase (NADPH)
VENVPAHLNYHRGIEEPNLETLKWIQQSAFKERLHLQKNLGITHISKNSQGIFELSDSKGGKHFAEYVILCTGVMDVQPIIQGSIETVFDYANAQTIDYCLICDGHHGLNKKTGVIGHANGAASVAIMLYERYRPQKMTIFTHGEKALFAEDTSKLIKAYGIQVNEQSIDSILGEEKGKVLQGFRLKDGNEIKLDICFVALGMIVYNELAKMVGADLDERGFVKADESGLTSVPNFYVAGDLKAGTKKQIYTAWDHAVNAANAINQKLRIARRNREGII